MLEIIIDDLKKQFDARVVDELLAAYQEAKKNLYLGGLRLSAVEGGRFCEAAFRMLQQKTTGSYTPVGTQIDSGAIIAALAKIPQAREADSSAFISPARCGVSTTFEASATRLT